jgi:hypothetical protein
LTWVDGSVIYMASLVLCGKSTQRRGLIYLYTNEEAVLIICALRIRRSRHRLSHPTDPHCHLGQLSADSVSGQSLCV